MSYRNSQQSGESAQEIQCGPIPQKQHAAQRQANYAMPPDTLWDKAFSEFRRMRSKGLTNQEAAGVFEPFLSDPDRKDAARFVLDLYGRAKT